MVVDVQFEISGNKVEQNYYVHYQISFLIYAEYLALKLQSRGFASDLL